MSTTTHAATSRAAGCNGGGRDPGAAGSTLLPVSPFYAPRYHFGMLLGVDDFETEQAYHRGKLRLHNAWLHGEGVVWGLRVTATERGDVPGTLTGEIQVDPGLALDAAGRELYLENPACVSVPAWYEANREEPELQAVVEIEEDGTIRFDAHVIACFRACLARPVPAISEPCEGAGTDTAYSRARETVELRLVPGAPPERRYPYRRLRLLFALEPAAPDREGDPYPDSQVVADREAVLALDAADQPAAYLEAFRRLAAYDEMDLAPAGLQGDGGESLLFPADDDTCVVLAAVDGITLRSVEGRLTLAAAEVDNTVRPSHVATSTIQELLCGPLFAALAAPGGEEPEEEEPEEEEPGEEEPEEPEEPGEEEPGEEEPEEPGEEEPGEDEPTDGEPGGEEPGGEEPEEPGRDGGEAGGEGEEPVRGRRPVLTERPPVADRGAGGGRNGAGRDAGGPRIDPASVELEGEVITLRASARLSRQSVTPAAFAVSAFDNRSGWRVLEVRAATLDGQGTRVGLELADGGRGGLLRIVAHGTGPTPLLGTNLVPLAGAVDGPAASEHDGHDFVLMLTRSET